MLENGNMSTYLYVHSHEKFKFYLDVKYLKTMNVWDSRGISYTDHIEDTDVDALIANLNAMCSTTSKFECPDCKNTFKIIAAVRSAGRL